MDLTTAYSPWDLLPAPEPRTDSPPETYFYNSVAKPLITDVIRIMNNGIPINLDEVQKVEATIDTILQQVDDELQSNPIIKSYQLYRAQSLRIEFITEQRNKLKTASDFIKPFDLKSTIHRSAFMKVLTSHNPPSSSEEILPGIPKWSARDVKAVQSLHPAIELYVSGKIQPTNTYCIKAMELIATIKADLYNKPIYDKIHNPSEYITLPPFNVASSTQKKELFDMLGIESEAKSKTSGEDSWSRDQIERINKETDDPAIKSLTQSMIDYSFGAIVKQNFIKAFYERSAQTDTGTRLFGSLTLFGAKTFRLTSQAPKLSGL